MPAGAPQKFKTPEEMQKQIDMYFLECDEKEDPYTITGLALALDTTRETLLDYEKDNPKFAEFSDTIKKAKLKCQNYAEKRLFGQGQCAGVIFNMKNNYNWKDKTEHQVDTDAKLEISWEK